VREDDPVVNRLVGLGLTVYEARAYWGLVRRERSTGTELARVTGLPRQRVYDVLERLVERGFAAVHPGRTMLYAAADPHVVLKRLVDEHRRRLEAAEAASGPVLEQLLAAYQEGRQVSDPLDYIHVLRDPGAVAERFADLQRNIKHEMLTFAKAPFVVSVGENEQGLKAARRVRLRTVYELAVLDDAESRSGVDRFISEGEEARFTDELPMKLGIIDQRIVMLAMQDPVAGTSNVTTLVIEHPQLAAALALAFASVWEQALNLEQADRVRADRARPRRSGES
jgi:sugar-specific transcriptional regulator TrmB